MSALALIAGEATPTPAAPARIPDGAPGLAWVFESHRRDDQGCTLALLALVRPVGIAIKFCRGRGGMDRVGGDRSGARDEVDGLDHVAELFEC